MAKTKQRKVYQFRAYSLYPHTNFVKEVFSEVEESFLYQEHLCLFKNDFVLKSRELAKELGVDRFRVITSFMPEHRFHRAFKMRETYTDVHAA
jgi:hypothetical protein